MTCDTRHHAQPLPNTAPTFKVCHGWGLDRTHCDRKAEAPFFFFNDAFPSLSYHVCATVKRLCLWMLLLSSMRRSRRGELRGERRGEMDEGDRRCPLGLSGCSRFSRRIFTRSSFRPECLGMGGTARVSWWVTPMPACWAMPAPGSTRTTTTTTSQMNGDSQRNRTSRYSPSESKNPLEF